MAEPKIVFDPNLGVYVLKIGGVERHFKSKKKAKIAAKKFPGVKQEKLKPLSSKIPAKISGLFKRLVKRLRKPPKQATRPISPQEVKKRERQQRELAKRIGHIPGVRIPGVSPEEAARLHTQATGWSQWYTMNSTNVDRIRYLESARLCQAVYKKKGDLYQYEGVEPEIFLGWLQTHSPGQYQWYVIRAYGYRYSKLASGQDVSPPRQNRFEGEPFAVPQAIEDFQRTRGRSSVDIVPTAVGFAPPPTDAWKQFRRP